MSRLYNLKFKVNVLKGADDQYVDNIIRALLYNNYLKNNDKVTIGKKGIIVNHCPIKLEDGKVIEMDSFQKPYSYEPVKERKKQSQPYRIEGDVALQYLQQDKRLLLSSLLIKKM